MTTMYTVLLLIFVTYFRLLSQAHSSEIKFPRFYKADNPLPVSHNIVSTVQARSSIDCALYCLSLNLTSFSFNAQQGSCEVGNLTVNNVSNYTQTDFYISCNTKNGFKLIIKDSIIACVWLSTTASNYAKAREICTAMSSHLYTVKTLEKLAILQDNYSNISKIWIGLNDIAAEGDYRWEDDNSVCDVSWQSMIYIPGEPNNVGDEDCNIFNFKSPKINDFPCGDSCMFICEKPFYNIP